MAGFNDASLRNLLKAQEFPDGTFAQEIRLEQNKRCMREAAATIRLRRWGFTDGH